MTKESFEDYLKAVHAEEYIGLDDDMPEAFDDWLGELGSDDFIMHADNAIQRVKEGKPLNKMLF